MMLEDLADELFLNLFEYFDSIHLIRAFYSFNSRLNDLFFIHFQSYSLDFRSVSKTNFDNIYQQHLLSIAPRIVSFHLSNNDETPNLVEYFLSQSVALKQFDHLKSLSLYDINSLQILNRLILQCRYFLYLTHLYIIKCKFSWEDNCACTLINNIWSLPKLSHLKFDVFFFNELEFTVIKVISLSIEHLSINAYNWNWYSVSHLFEYTPSLRYLSTISINASSNNEYLNSVVPLMNDLKVSLTNSFSTTPISLHSIKNLFSNMTNLSHLTIETTNIYLDGHEWREIPENGRAAKNPHRHRPATAPPRPAP